MKRGYTERRGGGEGGGQGAMGEELGIKNVVTLIPAFFLHNRQLLQQ